jgi:hypothetical protein
MPHGIVAEMDATPGPFMLERSTYVNFLVSAMHVSRMSWTVAGIVLCANLLGNQLVMLKENVQ